MNDMEAPEVRGCIPNPANCPFCGKRPVVKTLGERIDGMVGRRPCRTECEDGCLTGSVRSTYHEAVKAWNNIIVA